MTQAERIIEKFGSLAALSKALGHRNPTTVQGWKESGFIPPKYHQAIFDIGRSMGVALSPEDFLTVHAAGADSPHAA